MSEMITEGYAVLASSDGTQEDLELVAVFTSKISAMAYISRAYTPETLTKINHVFFGVDPF